MKQGNLKQVLLKVLDTGVTGEEPVSRATLEAVVAGVMDPADDIEIMASFVATWALCQLGLYERALTSAESLGSTWYRRVLPGTTARVRAIYASILAETYLLNGQLLLATSFSRMAVDLLAEEPDVESSGSTMLWAQSLVTVCLAISGDVGTRGEWRRTLSVRGDRQRVTQSEEPWTMGLATVLMRYSRVLGGESTTEESTVIDDENGDPGWCPFDWMVVELGRLIDCVADGRFQQATSIVECVRRRPKRVPVPPILASFFIDLGALAHVHSSEFFTAMQLLDGRISLPGHAVCLEVPRSMALLSVGNPRRVLTCTQRCVALDADHHMGSRIFVLLQRALAQEMLDNQEAADREFSSACHLWVEAANRYWVPRSLDSSFDGLLARLRDTEGELFAQLMTVTDEGKSDPYTLMRSVSPPEWLPTLSYSEFAVAQWFASDMTMAQIANKLGLSINTVKTHSRIIYSKLGVHSRGEAVEKLERIDFPHKSPSSSHAR